MFEPQRPLAKLGAKLCAGAVDPRQGPAPLRLLEHLSKAALFRCKDCGDCSLAEVAYLCPESQCAKNQRNGPCGGTQNGRCEVAGFGDCIWLRAYERLKHDGRADRLLSHTPVVQDQALRGTSSWANHWLGRDHATPGQRPNLHHDREKITIVGELMNNSYARARSAFTARRAADYGSLARIQANLGASYLTLNLDGTQRLQVKMEEMLSFLPEVIAAIQAATDVPISFDNPAVAYHEVALRHYDRARSGPPILNSIAASRHNLDAMVELVRGYDTHVIVMASEHFVPGGTAPCMSAADAHEVAKHFVELLRTKAGGGPTRS
jgi:hypothetical protein